MLTCHYQNLQNFNLLHIKRTLICTLNTNVFFGAFILIEKLTEQKQHYTPVRGILHKDQAQQNQFLM